MYSPGRSARNGTSSPGPTPSSPRHASLSDDEDDATSGRDDGSSLQRLEDQPLLSPPAYDDIRQDVPCEGRGSPTSTVEESSQAKEDETKGMGYLLLLTLPVGG